MKSKALIRIIIISLVIFIVILLKVLYGNHRYDILISTLMPAIHSNFFISLSKIIAFIFDTISMVLISLIIAIILLLKHYKKESLFFALIMIINAVVIYFMKEIVARIRPLSSAVSESGFSFPSGHATTSVVFFGFLTYFVITKSKSKFLKVLTAAGSIIMIILIGFTRIYLNVHWLSDVIAGIALGTFIITVGILLKEKNKITSQKL